MKKSYIKVSKSQYGRLIKVANEVLNRLETLEDACEATELDRVVMRKLQIALEALETYEEPEEQTRCAND